MAQVIAEITHGASKACLYEPPTYEEWFNSHSYHWCCRNQTFLNKPSVEFTNMYRRARDRHTKQQSMMIKTFIRNCNCNGKRRTKIHQDS